MYFTPKINSLKEDDGYLMGYVHDIEKNISYFDMFIIKF